MQRQFRIVQVGCGGMGQRWVETALKTPGIQIVGLADINPVAAKQTAEKFQLPSDIVYPSLDAALAATKPDVVFDVTVPASHEAVVIQALNHGCHVLGEKPLSDSMQSAARMVAAAERNNRIYAVTQNQRYMPGIRSLHQFLLKNSIGPIEEIHLDFFIGAHFGGFRDQMDYPLITDMAIHHFDAARFITGADPLSVYCHSFNPPRSWYRGDASAVAIFEMTNRITFSYRGSWCSEGLHTDWHCNWRVVGSTGSVQWDGQNAFGAEAIKPDAPLAFFREVEKLDVPLIPMPLSAHAAIMQEFFAALRENRSPETDCHDNIKSLAMVLAAVESAQSGKKLAVQC